MSHQDLMDGTVNAEHLQAAWRELAPKAVLEGLAFQKDSRWQPTTLAFAALLWSWSGERALTDRFAQALKILLRLQGDAPPPGRSYQGFLKRLRCWSQRLLERLQAEFRRRMLQDFAEQARVAGWLLLAADGSRCEAPRTVSNQEHFAAPKKTAALKKNAGAKAARGVASGRCKPSASGAAASRPSPTAPRRPRPRSCG